jgi:hypothetical protein
VLKPRMRSAACFEDYAGSISIPGGLFRVKEGGGGK